MVAEQNNKTVLDIDTIWKTIEDIKKTTAEVVKIYNDKLPTIKNGIEKMTKINDSMDKLIQDLETWKKEWDQIVATI
jgi:uncharacterized protein YaaN involved in tellurite resistance